MGGHCLRRTLPSAMLSSQRNKTISWSLGPGNYLLPLSTSLISPTLCRVWPFGLVEFACRDRSRISTSHIIQTGSGARLRSRDILCHVLLDAPTDVPMISEQAFALFQRMVLSFGIRKRHCAVRKLNSVAERKTTTNFETAGRDSRSKSLCIHKTYT